MLTGSVRGLQAVSGSHACVRLTPLAVFTRKSTMAAVFELSEFLRLPRGTACVETEEGAFWHLSMGCLSGCSGGQWLGVVFDQCRSSCEAPAQWLASCGRPPAHAALPDTQCFLAGGMLRCMALRLASPRSWAWDIAGAGAKTIRGCVPPGSPVAGSSSARPRAARRGPGVLRARSAPVNCLRCCPSTRSTGRGPRMPPRS